ncbi:unnamed protein product [Cuscuta epithymum]|uniref:Phytocyanin domain-containing protein n=1 Tax=Cuscuta epithymum TaxID=186058 RepID=A0AAV0EZP0_9ASTE|nr:unnamed protein product [Cuscuta epithymum]
MGVPNNAGTIVVVLVLSILCNGVPSLGTTFNVGGSDGWGLTGDYKSWSKGKTFKVGDTLVFKYPDGHTVNEVSESDYNSCTAANSITSDSSGTTTVALKTAGNHYFICSSAGHCANGMKLAVNVVKDSGSPTPSSPAADATSTSPSTPPKKGSSSSAAASLPLVPWLAMISLVAAVMI